MSERPVTRQLYLAKFGKTGMPRLEDGPHSDEEGVARAAKLMLTIFRDEGPWVMVELHPLPQLDPSINDEAAETCAGLVWGKHV